MSDIEVTEETVEDQAGDRVRESVRHALRLVGPAEGGAERSWTEVLRSEQASRAR